MAPPASPTAHTQHPKHRVASGTKAVVTSSDALKTLASRLKCLAGCHPADLHSPRTPTGVGGWEASHQPRLRQGSLAFAPAPRPWRDRRLAAPRPLWRASVEPTQLLHLRAFSAASLALCFSAAFAAASSFARCSAAFSAAAFSAPAFSAPAFSAAAFTSAWRRDTSVWVRVRVRVRARASRVSYRT